MRRSLTGRKHISIIIFAVAARFNKAFSEKLHDAFGVRLAENTEKSEPGSDSESIDQNNLKKKNGEKRIQAAELKVYIHNQNPNLETSTNHIIFTLLR